MPSRLYTNADVQRRYTRPADTFGPWTRITPLTEKDDPYAGLPFEHGETLDDVVGEAKRFDQGLSVGNLRRTVDRQLERESQDAAESRARRGSNPLSAFVTSVFSPEQRESVARAIEGDSRNEEGLIPRARSFAAGAVGGAGEDSPWGGLMGEVSPLNVGTGFGITRTTPISMAIKAAREAQAVQGARRATAPVTAAIPDVPAPAAAVTDTPAAEGLMARMRRWLTGGEESTPVDRFMPNRAADDLPIAADNAAQPFTRVADDVDPFMANRPANRQMISPDNAAHRFSRAIDDVDPFMPNRAATDELISPDNAARPFTRAVDDIDPFMPNRPASNTGAIDADHAAYPLAPADDLIDRYMPNVSSATGAPGTTTPRVPFGGGEMSFLRQTRPQSRARIKAREAADEAALPDAEELGEVPSFDLIDDAPPIPQTVVDPEGGASLINGLIRQLSQRGAARTSAPAALDPNRLLPAMGETAEGMAPQRLGFTRRTRTLRPEQTTLELANELAQSEIGPGARVKSLKAYPRPAGEDELSRALRQRSYLSEKSRSGATAAGRDERGFADPAMLSFLARTGGGAAFGGANPGALPWVDDDERVKGAAVGALLGGIAPDLGRSVGRIARSVPKGLPQLRNQVFDEVQGARYMGMLSGLAIPKSIAGNIAAPVWKGLESGNLGRQLGAFWNPRTVRKYFQELRNPTIPATMEQKAAPSLIGRVLHAGDAATTDALTRGGATADEAAEHLLRTPTGKLGFTGPVGDFLQSRPGKAVLPFQTTPLNQAVHGGRRLGGLEGRKKQAIAGLVSAAGFGHGSLESSDPLEIGMTAPFAGVYSLPYLMGAGAGMVGRGALSAASAVGRGVNPAPELGMDVINLKKYFRPFTDPGFNVYSRESDAGRPRRTPAATRRRRITRPER